ncbi:MAG: glycerol-3-phosphate acyltransferase [Chloroflexota bacterium]
MIAAGLILGSYLLGSIPAAYIAGRLLKKIDIRKMGDGNVGAANAYREIGPGAGITVLLADIAKGAIAILLTQALAAQPIVFLAGLAAVLGHNWPIYLGFKGGRGEATAIGVLGALLPQPTLILVGVCLFPLWKTRNTMLAGAIIFAPLWAVAWLTGASGALISYSIGLPCVVGITHLLKTRHLPKAVRKEGKYMR